MRPGKHVIGALVALACMALAAQAQQRNFNWVFASGTWLQFSADTMISVPMADTVSLRNASISDVNGQFALLADDFGIRNALFQTLPGGSPADLGWNVPAANYLIVPMPGPGDRYAVFITEEAPTARAGWVEVDLGANGGAGAVVGTTNWLMQNATAKLTATTDAGETGYWVLLHGDADDAFHAYHLLASGLDPVPVVSHAGTPYLASAPERNMDRYGKMFFSFQGDRLAVVKNDTSLDTNKVEVFNFNRANGVLTHWADISLQEYGAHSDPELSGIGLRMLEGDFDLSGRYLYLGIRQEGITNGLVYQFDLGSVPDSLVNSAFPWIGAPSTHVVYDGEHGAFIATAPLGYDHDYPQLGSPASGTLLMRMPVPLDFYATLPTVQFIRFTWMPWGPSLGWSENPVYQYGRNGEYLQQTNVLGGFPSPCKRYCDDITVGVPEPADEARSLIGIRPNPMQARAVLEFSAPAIADGLRPESVIWRDALGREVKCSHVARLGPSFILERDGLPGGLYVVEVRTKERSLGVVKV
ncbi:MAG TPA: hypothetical protein PLZ25_14775, partial [Flavobacteriales bacterium]|nr:hypothetical protein [Flavobacteriales bacterium]